MLKDKEPINEKQIALLLFLCIISNLLANILPINLPGNVIGMLLLLVFLATRIIKLGQIEPLGDFIAKNMPIMFVPAGCSLIETYPIIANDIFVFVFVCIVSTIITFIATAYSVIFLLKMQNKMKGKSDFGKEVMKNA